MPSQSCHKPAVPVVASRSAALLANAESKDRPAVLTATLRPAPHVTSVSFSDPHDSLIDDKFTRDPLLLTLAVLCASVGMKFQGLQSPVASDEPLVIYTTPFGASGAISLAGFGTSALQRHAANVYARFGMASPYLERERAASAGGGR